MRTNTAMRIVQKDELINRLELASTGARRVELSSACLGTGSDRLLDVFA